MSRRSAVRARAHLWQRVLQGHRFPSGTARSAVWLSAVVDVARQAIPALSSPAPLGLVGMTVSTGDARFRARALTDDLYILLPGREKDVHDAILDSLRPGDTFVDVGANVGYYAVMAARRVGPTGRVIAVEGWPGTVQALRHNLALNGSHNVEVVEAAVVGDPAVTRVGFQSHPRASGLSRAVSSSDAPTVPATTLDWICRDLGQIRMMKIDIEGGEVTALEGASATLGKTQSVVVETEELSKVAETLGAAGFEVGRLAFTTHLIGRRGPA